MHRLTREIRFTISPWQSLAISGNSYCSKPDCEGMGVYFSLWVELGGEMDKQTGFVVNLTDIDKVCRRCAVPIFEEIVKRRFAEHKDITITDLKQTLERCNLSIAAGFSPAKVLSLALKINPQRKIKILTGDKDMIYYSEKFEFAAMHKLWNDSFSVDENFATFGKCANIAGHGHNYIVEVTVKTPDGQSLRYSGLQQAIIDNLIELLDHKNLNEDVPYFANINPTVENITAYAWKCLEGKFANVALHEITIWETDRAYCSYRNE